MRLKRGAWDGAQPRGHILKVLRGHGVACQPLGDDWYELVDLAGDPEVLYLPEVVTSELVTHLWRRFGDLHGFRITDLVKPRSRH